MRLPFGDKTPLIGSCWTPRFPVCFNATESWRDVGYEGYSGIYTDQVDDRYCDHWDSAAIAIPNYNDYLTRSRITEAVSTLSDAKVRLEQYFQDNRFYNNDGTASTTCGIPAIPARRILRSCVAGGASRQTFVLTATGRDPGSMKGFPTQSTRPIPGVRQLRPVRHGQRPPEPGVGLLGRAVAESCAVATVFAHRTLDLPSRSRRIDGDCLASILGLHP